MLERMWRKRISFALLVAMQAGAAALENSMEVPQKVKKRTTLRPSNCTTRHLSEGYRCAVSKGHMHPHVYSSTINNSQSMESTQSMQSMEKYIYSTHTMEYYLAIKKNETLPFAATWMELEGITLSKISQKDKYQMTSFIRGL